MSALSRAFVMGHPIAHSRSPLLHGYWLKKMGIEGTYERLDIAPDRLNAFFSDYRETGWVGGNVTVPHKSAVIPYLDRIDSNARALGAVNTIWWDDGQLIGGNTDGIGFMDNLDELAPGWDSGARNSVIIGAGGAARAAVHGVLGRGLSVSLCNRTQSKAQALAEYFDGDVRAHSLDELPGLLEDADLLVNTTSLGMVGQPPLDIDLAPLKPTATVYDIVYVPLETPLIIEAKAKGHPVVGGLGMLLHQGVPGFSHWFGQTPTVSVELRNLLTDDIVAKSPSA
ncbi:MAG: shikimate dehydrogenase [Granulosicoccus sp.]|nr:shikimate dehydrogenase [Granulosicoccus sp.]